MSGPEPGRELAPARREAASTQRVSEGRVLFAGPLELDQPVHGPQALESVLPVKQASL